LNPSAVRCNPGGITTAGEPTMDDTSAHIATWLSADTLPWAIIVAPALIALAIVAFVLVTGIRRHHKQ